MSSLISRAIDHLRHFAAISGRAPATSKDEMPDIPSGTIELDNSGDGPLTVPGFNGIRIDYIPKGDDGPIWESDDQEQDSWPLFQHGVNSWHGQRLTVRELACKLLNHREPFDDR